MAAKRNASVLPPATIALSRRTIVFIVAAAILLGLSLRIAAIDGKRLIIFDESIAYLAATGHQREYGRIVHERQPPYGVWSDVRAWKRLSEPEERFCFSAISDGLSNGDIHPPLYFWLLHLWSLAWGVHLWTGPTLNLIFFLGTAVAIFGLGKEVLKDARAAAVVAFVWSVSPVVIPSTCEARQYELLALWTVLLVWIVHRETAADRRQWTWGLVGLAAVTAGGLLTHYHFVLSLSACGAFALWRTRRELLPRLVRLGGAVLSGCAAFAWLHPGFWESIVRARTQAETDDVRTFTQRVDQVLSTYASFFVDPGGGAARGHRVLACVVLVLVLLVGVRVLIGLRSDRRAGAERGMRAGSVLFFLGWGAGLNVVLYLTSMSPGHAMAAKYPCMVWPFYAFLPVMGIRSLRRGRAVLTGALCFGVLVGGGMRVVRYRRESAAMSRELHRWATVDRMLFDNVGRGVLPVFMMHVPEGREVFAARGSDLIERPDRWLGHLTPGDAYVMSVKTPKAVRMNLIELLDTRFRRRQQPYYIGRLAAFRIMFEGEPSP